MEKNWYEELGRAVAEELSLSEGSDIEHQCGTVWVKSCGYNGEVIAISGMKTEAEEA